MTESTDWSIPSALQPRAQQLSFDLDAALQSVVQLRSEVAEDAFTAGVLGTARSGNGIVLQHAQQTVVLTVGYLITEAHSVWLTTYDGRIVAGHPLAYDQVTGFGLVLPLGELNTPHLQLGSTDSLVAGSEVLIIGHGGASHSLNAKLLAKREFAGYWEYLLETALFTTPPHPQWGGTAMVDHHGKLAAVGALLMQEATRGDTFDTNVFIPVDLLLPIIDDLLLTGKVNRPTRPWLGLYSAEQQGGHIVVAGVIEEGPAFRAGVRAGDLIESVAGRHVKTLAEFYRTLWAQGPAGSVVTLAVRRGKRTTTIDITSAARDDFLLQPRAH